MYIIAKQLNNNIYKILNISALTVGLVLLTDLWLT